MNKTMKWIYAALVCILVGAGLIIAVGTMNDWDPARFGGEIHLAAQRFPVEESFSAIDLRGCGGADVTLLPAENGVCRVVTGVSADGGVETTVEVKDGVLYVKREDKRPWHAHIGFQSWTGEDDVTIFLPEERLAELALASSSGNVLVESGLAFGRFAAESTSGTIRFRADAAESLSLKTSSGDIRVENNTCGDVALASTSGEIRVLGLRCRDFTCSSTSGDQRLEALEAAGDLKTQSMSGEQKLLGVKTAGALTLTSTSGDLRFEGLDAASAVIQSSSGEVYGTVARRMNFRASSTSGEVSIPEPDPKGGDFRVSTSSGDVKIRLA